MQFRKAFHSKSMTSRREIHLDGRKLEGGGQLLRLAVGLCALTKQRLKITSIRGNRRGKGGLKSQHLRAIDFLAAACSADCEGAHLTSKELTFAPRPAVGAPAALLPTNIQIGSPGSICLVIQAILPYLVFAGFSHLTDKASDNISININGGTNITNSPSFDYFLHVLLPTLSKIGLHGIDLQLHERGWIGRGSRVGLVTVTVTPLPPNAPLPSWSLTDRGAISRVEAYLRISNQHEKAAINAIKSEVALHVGQDTDVEVHFEDTQYISYLLLIAVSENGHRLGRDWLYDGNFKKDRDRLPEVMAAKVVQMLKTEIDHGGCVDEYMRDELVAYQALADGECEVDYGSDESGATMTPSLHARTAVWVTEQVLGVSWKSDRSCIGVGFKSQ